MMLPQLGLVLLNWLPLILPLALMLGLMLGDRPALPGLGNAGDGLDRRRPAADAEAAAAGGAADGGGGRGLLAVAGRRGPSALSKQMINEANRNLIVAGLEPGAFTEIPGGGGVIYVGTCPRTAAASAACSSTGRRRTGSTSPRPTTAN